MGAQWMAGVVVTVAIAALAGSIAGADDGGPRLAEEVEEVAVSFAGAERHVRAASGRPAKRPKVIYLEGRPVTVDPGDPGAGAHVDIALKASPCSGRGRILDGGAVPSRGDVYQQGTYVDPGASEYHVLLGIRDDAPDDPYTVSSHLICAKGVR